MKDAFQEFENCHPNLNKQQKLTSFFNFINLLPYSEIEIWKNNWKHFYKKIDNKENSAQPSSSQANITNSTIGTFNQIKRSRLVFTSSSSDNFLWEKKKLERLTGINADAYAANAAIGAADATGADDYINSECSDQDGVKSYNLDYLVGLDVVNYDLNKLDDDHFNTLSINNINYSERYLVYRQTIIEKAESKKVLRPGVSH